MGLEKVSNPKIAAGFTQCMSIKSQKVQKQRFADFP